MPRVATAFLLLASALAACSEGSPAKSAGQSDGVSGAAIYANQGCVLCHGSDGAGTSFGPTLHGKKAHWTREKLVLYLKNPTAYAQSDPRLAEQSKKYTLPMQRYDVLPEAELAALAEHVLGLP